MALPDLDTVRRSTSATLNEIAHGERNLKAQGIDVFDEMEWMELRDILARIERRMLANAKDIAA